MFQLVGHNIVNIVVVSGENAALRSIISYLLGDKHHAVFSVDDWYKRLSCLCPHHASAPGKDDLAISEPCYCNIQTRSLTISYHDGLHPTNHYRNTAFCCQESRIGTTKRRGNAHP
jgi:hypothetical protein